MPFERNLRRLLKKLPEHDVPSGLQAHVFSQLTEPDRLQKVGFDMKLILIPALALSLMGAVGGVYLLRSSTFLPFQQRKTVQTGPVTLHFVEEEGKPVAGANILLSGYKKPDPRTGVSPALRVEDMPQRTTDTEGNLTVTPEMQVTNFFVSTDGDTPRWAAGEITVSEGVQTITLSEHPEHSITGQFVDEQGKPLTDVQPELFVGSQSFSKLTPGPDGHFIAWVVPGTAYYLVFHRTGPGNPIEMKKDLRVEKGQFLDLGAVTVRSGTPPAQ